MPLHLIFFKTQQSETNLFIKKKKTTFVYVFGSDWRNSALMPVRKHQLTINVHFGLNQVQFHRKTILQLSHRVLC